MKKIIQITSGRGPEECMRVVACVQELLIKDAKKNNINISVLSSTKGPIKGTLLSSTMLVEGKVEEFIKEWEGTIQWISKSPYRKHNKRKNWFIGVSTFDIDKKFQFDINDVEIKTARSSGPGGQSVNKTNSAVRVKHIPTGIQINAMDSRSALENKASALQRLEEKLLSIQSETIVKAQQDKWQEHNILERGNPIKTIQKNLK